MIPYVSGPANIYFSRTASNSYPASAATIFFLGTCEQPPTLQLNPQWEPIINDQGGIALPIDYTYQGEDGVASLVLNKWNEAIYAVMATHNLIGIGGGATLTRGLYRGSERWMDIGTIAQLEGLTFHLWMQFPYAAAKAFGATYGLPNGYHFPACRMAAHQIMPGTRANKRQLVVHLDRAVIDTGASNTQGFVLHDHVMTYLPAAVPPTAATGAIS